MFKRQKDVKEVLDLESYASDVQSFIKNVCEQAYEKYIETFDLDQSSIEIDCTASEYDADQWASLFRSHILNVENFVYMFNAKSILVDTWTVTKKMLHLTPSIEPIPLHEEDINVNRESND